ncbi:hypothetical protein CRENBAI_022285 [Crenichthys baileyi]|uniref:Uncharacterized protein n=1 Tax=Crenichthys baileyi TaxID=28760 RepID=A0AAV9SGS1_9TELE
MRRPPVPSSAPLSIEAGGGFPAHGFTPDKPSPPLPTLDPVPGPVLGGFLDEPPSHPDPVPGPVPEGFLDEPPSHPDPVPSPVPEGFLDEPPSHPDPVPGPVPEGSQAEPPSHSVPVREGLVDGLPPLPAPVPGPVLEGSEDKLPPSLVPILEEFVEDLGARTYPLRLLCLGGSATELHGLAKGPSGLCTALLGSSSFRTVPLSSTMGSPGPAAGRQVIGSYYASLLSSCVTDLLIVFSYITGLLIARSAGEGHRAGRLNFGSVRGDLRAFRLNSYVM